MSYNPSNPIKTCVRSAATLPQSTQHALFTVSNGRVKIIDIVGEDTVVMGAVANDTKLIANPDVGAGVDLCAVLDTANDAVGTQYNLSGTFANPMYKAASGAFEGQANPFIVMPGTVDLHCATNNTGEVGWLIRYEQLDPGAVVTAA